VKRAAVAGRPSPLVERYRGRRFEELLRDPYFKRLSEVDVQALAADYRRTAKRLRGDLPEED
jgi:hypothetical protein